MLPLSAAPRTDSRSGRLLALICLGWLFDGMEMGLFPLISRPALQSLLGTADDRLVGLWTGRITALFLVGAAIGGPLFGWLGDRSGRVRALTLSIACYSLFTGLSFLAVTPAQLGALRFAAALGMGGEWSLGVSLAVEWRLLGSRERASGWIGAAGNLGFVLIAVVGWLLPVTRESWRWLPLLGAGPFLLALLIPSRVPESEAWKLARRAGERPGPLGTLASREYRGRAAIGILLATVAIMGSWCIVQWLPLWVDQLAGPSFPRAKAQAQTLISVGAVLGCLLGARVNAVLKRRSAYLAYSLASFACLQAFFHLGSGSGPGPAVPALAVAVGCATGAFYSWLPLYLPELFPTSARATGQGLSYNAGRILAAVAALQAGGLVRSLGGDYASAGQALSFVYLLGAGLALLAPETADRALPD